jgi:hypothetical protein
VSLDQFELLELRRDDGIQTFYAREVATARPVQVHLFAIGAADSLALLSRIHQLPDAERRRVIDRGVAAGRPYLVTDRLAGFASVREWLNAKAAPVSLDQQFLELFGPEVPEPPAEAEPEPKSLGAIALGVVAALVLLVLILVAIVFRLR